MLESRGLGRCWLSVFLNLAIYSEGSLNIILNCHSILVGLLWIETCRSSQSVERHLQRQWGFGSVPSQGQLLVLRGSDVLSSLLEVALTGMQMTGQRLRELDKCERDDICCPPSIAGRYGLWIQKVSLVQARSALSYTVTRRCGSK